MIAAAGNHSLLMIGPPGSGKTMLAQRLPGLLPQLTAEEALEVAAIAAVAQLDSRLGHESVRPFRAPHHTASAHAIVGGGMTVRPGEVSLAHHGVLFLDELPEFDRRVLEALREPLESGVISVVRANQRAEFPAAFQLVAAMNPCPCGHAGRVMPRCRCTPKQIDPVPQPDIRAVAGSHRPAGGAATGGCGSTGRTGYCCRIGRIIDDSAGCSSSGSRARETAASARHDEQSTRAG